MSVKMKAPLIALMVLTLLILSHAAGAQNNGPRIEPPPFASGSAVPPTDLPSGIGNYCIYESSHLFDWLTHLHWQDELHMCSDDHRNGLQSAGLLDDKTGRPETGRYAVRTDRLEVNAPETD